MVSAGHAGAAQMASADSFDARHAPSPTPAPNISKAGTPPSAGSREPAPREPVAHHVSRLRFTRGSKQDLDDGLIAYLTFLLDGWLYLDGFTLRRKRDAGY